LRPIRKPVGFDFGTRTTITLKLSIDVEALATKAWRGWNSTLTLIPIGSSGAITPIGKRAATLMCGA
jgi:hypothetical protein